MQEQYYHIVNHYVNLHLIYNNWIWRVTEKELVLKENNWNMLLELLILESQVQMDNTLFINYYIKEE